MALSRSIGDHHVDEVYRALRHKISTDTWLSNIQMTSRETAEKIWGKFPYPDNVYCKLEYSNPDQHNDIIIEKDSNIYHLNLFIVKGNSVIQPKNLGARSFLAKYFLVDDLQSRFNDFFDVQYMHYLKELLDMKYVQYSHMHETKELKAAVRERYPHFDDASNRCRDWFLLQLRDYCFSLIQHTYNTNQNGMQNALRTLLLADQTNIITRVYKDRIEVNEFIPKIDSYRDIIAYKKGRNSIGIQCGTISLTLRFKFENKPDSSIKLATSYETFEKFADFHAEIIQMNKRTIQTIEAIVERTEHSPANNISNAIGKCHEAFAYYWILKKIPTLIQTDDEECVTYLRNYLPKIEKTTAALIIQSSEETAEVISEYIYDQKDGALVEGIQLVADIYTTDRLNTGDLKLSIRYNNGQMEELYISLKAVRKVGQKITTKNPGIGTILGSTYFDLRPDFNNKVEEVREDYNTGLDHKGCLIKLSQEIGKHLELAPQENLRKGLMNLLGKALMIITAYEQKKAFYIEHQHISSNVNVLLNTPSSIQNTLIWNNGEEQLSLRVKFSSGHHHGWSSIKLTSEYLFNPN